MLYRGYERPARPKPRRAFIYRSLLGAAEGAVCFLLLGLFALGVCHFAYTDPLFRVQTIRVEGTKKLSDEAVIAQAGVAREDCLLSLDPKPVHDRIAAIAAVRGCSVTRHFPNKIVYAIDERSALATLMMNNRLFEVDDEGNVLRELAPDVPHVGPLITNVGGLECVEVGQQLTQRTLLAALGVWEAFSQTAMSRDVDVSEISAAQENRICMYCDQLPCEIRWGRSHFDKQARKLDIFWAARNKQMPAREYVDLRFSNDVACR